MERAIHRRYALKLAIAASAAALGCQGDPPIPTPAPASEGPAKVTFAKHEILMLVYPKFTALDLIGPQHVFALLGPEFKTRLVWKDTEQITSDTGIPIRPTLSFEDCPAAPTVLFVPGGTDGTLAAMKDKAVRDFVAGCGATSKYVTSACTGSLILGAAGLLQGYKATTHWLALEALAKFGAEPVAERVVVDRNRITGGGVTAGIDFALTLAAKIKDDSYAKGIQLMMEYDPQPPFQSGNPKTADPETVKLLEAMVVPFHQELEATIEQIKAQ